MKHDNTKLPTRLDAGGVHIQGQDWGGMNVARIRFPKGADAKPLLEGLQGNMCQCPHWGIVLKGSIHVDYADGKKETVRVDEDYEAIEFSPAPEMAEVVGHLRTKMGA